MNAQQLKTWEAEVEYLQEKISQQQAEIEALKKELALKNLSDIGQMIENEPVAWMLLGLEDRKPKLINLQVIDHLEGTWIPLYTHPNEDRDSAIYATGYWKGIDYKKMRELTDEEIDHTWFNHGWGSVEKDDLMKFARAILKKANDK
jgi:hypothetical protein